MKNNQLHYTSKPDKNLVSYDKLLDEVYRDKNKLLSLFLDPYSLGNGQFQILNMIGWEEGISQEGIVSKRNIDKSAVAKSVKKLIDNGYIYKVRDEQDKRAFCLYCTEKGKQVIPETREILHKFDRILTAGSTPDELRIFKDVIERMNQNVDDYLTGK